jgi:hypothetical protein
VAEIFVESEQMAELHQENPAGLTLEVYPKRDGKPWQVSCQEFIQMVEQARGRLGAQR